MPILLVVAGFFVPRFVLGLLWFFTDQMYEAFGNWQGPLLGFIFLPFATLVYTILATLGGDFSLFSWVAVGLALLLDIYQWRERLRKGSKKKSWRYRRHLAPGSMIVEGELR